MAINKEIAMARFQQVEDPPYLDRTFQSYLVEVGFMKRGMRDRGVDMVLESKMTEVQDCQNLSAKMLLLSILMGNKGWVVSNSRLIFSIYGGPADKMALDRLKLLQHNLGKGLGYSGGDRLLTISGVGRGIGVETFELSFTEPRLLHKLWLQSGNNLATPQRTKGVRIGVFAEEIFGENNFYNKEYVRLYIAYLRQKGFGKPFRIQTYFPRMDTRYGLVNTN